MLSELAKALCEVVKAFGRDERGHRQCEWDRQAKLLPTVEASSVATTYARLTEEEKPSRVHGICAGYTGKEMEMGEELGKYQGGR